MIENPVGSEGRVVNGIPDVQHESGRTIFQIGTVPTSHHIALIKTFNFGFGEADRSV